MDTSVRNRVQYDSLFESIRVMCEGAGSRVEVESGSGFMSGVCESADNLPAAQGTEGSHRRRKAGIQRERIE